MQFYRLPLLATDFDWSLWSEQVPSDLPRVCKNENEVDSLLYLVKWMPKRTAQHKFNGNTRTICIPLFIKRHFRHSIFSFRFPHRQLNYFNSRRRSLLLGKWRDVDHFRNCTTVCRVPSYNLCRGFSKIGQHSPESKGTKNRRDNSQKEWLEIDVRCILIRC